MDNQENELYKLSASEANFLIKSRKITVKQFIESIIQQTEKINPQTNAWTCLNFKRSLEQADILDKKITSTENLSPIYGIPIGIKDIFNTVDFPTEMGSPLWKNFTPGNDARVVSYLRMADSIIFGKTETAEFAVHTLGKSKNPYDPTRSPGTSSSGSAVAVATFTVPIALGSQTAGSIIRPASFCGIYGFKPSFGLIPRTGMLKTTDTLDQVGYFARTPSDLELLFDIVRVKGRDYPLSEAALGDKKRQTVIDRQWRIKFVKSAVWEQAEPYARKHIENFIDRLIEERNFHVTEFVLPEEFSRAHRTHQIIYAKSLSYYFKTELQNRSLVSDTFYEFANQAKEITMEQYEMALEYQSKISRILDSSFKEFDIIISLSTAGQAPLRNEKEKDDPSLIWTMCGVPSISMPIVETQNGLPMGIQSIARRYNDKLLLKFVNLLRHKNLIPDGPYPKLDLK